MEKQKVFWVVLSVSVFVVVVLIVGVLLLRQHPAATPQAAVSSPNDTGTQVYEYQREAPQTPPATGPQAGTPGTGDQQTLHFYIGEGGAQSPQAGGAAPSTGASPSAGAVPAAPAMPQGTLPRAVAAPAARPQSIPMVKPGTTRPTVTARAPRRTTDYWIQAGAYKSQGKAEDLATLLQGKGLGSRVFSYALNGDTWYRVRVGPYSNKGEAGKFLALVRQVQGLESSYISMVPAGKSSVN